MQVIAADKKNFSRGSELGRGFEASLSGVRVTGGRGRCRIGTTLAGVRAEIP